ncbi:MAG: 50S ribosomal protein L13 [Candidatus Aminicenantia bacterium]
METYFPKKNEIEKKWWLIDAQGKVLGRLASQIALLLRGKHKPQFTNFIDTGDFVIVVNAEKVRVTGKKRKQKTYRSHSGYPGGLKEITFEKMINTKPEEVIRKAVWGMLPKNKLGRALFKKLKVYQGSNHPHQAQNPEIFQIEEKE